MHAPLSRLFWKEAGGWRTRLGGFCRDVCAPRHAIILSPGAPQTLKGSCELIGGRDKGVSRKDAKYAKAAKERKDFDLAFLCALAPWRELF